MKGLFWLSLLLIAYTYAGYPLIVALLAKFRPHPHLRKAWPQTTEKPISIVMAVHNGAALVRRKLEVLLGLDYPAELLQLIVVSDGSTDETKKARSRATSVIRYPPAI